MHIYQNNLLQMVTPANRISRYTCNEANYRNSEAGPAGNAQRYNFDAQLSISERYEPLGQCTQMHYDHNRQILKVIHPGGSKLTWTRDNFGNVLTYTDLGSAETRYILDGLKRVVEQIASGGNHDQYVKIVKTTQIIVFISQVTAHTFALDAYKQAFVNLNGSAHTGNTSH